MQLNMAALLLNLLVEVLLIESAAQALMCNGNEYIISRDETITPPHLVEVSDDATPLDTPAENVLYFGYNANDMYTWCSDTDDPDPYVIIHFTEPVFITSFLSSGTTNFAFSALSTYYLTNFTLEYANSTAGEYTYYTEQHSGNRKYFSQSEPAVLFRLERPLVTESLRIRPVQWLTMDDSGREFYHYICLGVALFGCTQEETTEEVTAEPVTMEATVSDPSITGGTTDSDPSITGGTTDSDPLVTGGTTGGVATAQQIVVIRDYQVLEIALPVSLLTLLIVIVIMIIGVLVCFIWGRGNPVHKYDVPLTTPLSPAPRILDNAALYNTVTPIDIDEGVTREVKNDLYGDYSLAKTPLVEPSTLEIIYSDDQYEYISDPINSRSEDNSRSEENNTSEDNNSLEDNSAYVFSEQGGEATPTLKDEFQLIRNDSYQVAERLDNVYEDYAQL